jgi:hypothetical protein
MKTGRELTQEYRKFYAKLGYRVTREGNRAGLIRGNKSTNMPKGAK